MEPIYFMDRAMIHPLLEAIIYRCHGIIAYLLRISLKPVTVQGAYQVVSVLKLWFLPDLPLQV